MAFLIQMNNFVHNINFAKPLDIAIPLDFNNIQPNAYGVEKAISKSCEAENLIGDTRRGGSCNFEQVKLIPHCNGTHTECVGHITHERISIHNCLKDALVPAVLVSVEPETIDESIETYSVNLNKTDKLITRAALQKAFKNSKSKIQNPELEALIVRTLPNDESKKTRTYLEHVPPFFSTEAMQFIVEIDVKHLLVDLPSIDRIFDEGKLSNHRIFWNVEHGSFEINKSSKIGNTITELIYVPDSVRDEFYLLNLQIPPFVADAAPSRPVLFEIFE
jgi:kynurenine formamidase